MVVHHAPCPFCSVSECKVTASHSLAIVKRDEFPLTQGHSLVIPRRHIASFFGTTGPERVALFELLDRAKAGLDAQYRPKGYNIVINDGISAGQTIMHLHVHLIPRYEGDCEDPRGGIRWIFPERAAYWKR
jgi:diadenosine tetraphosphate (Ap4A) HIT family hydrolase